MVTLVTSLYSHDIILQSAKHQSPAVQNLTKLLAIVTLKFLFLHSLFHKPQRFG